MFPIALGLAAAQVNVFVDTVLGTQLPHGRVAALRYADTVAQVPLGTFSQALAFVLFPFLARDAAVGALDTIRRRASLALRLNIFALVPASAGLAVLSLPIVALLFQHGAFDQESSRQTALALLFFSFGLTGQAATALLVRVFYALQDVMAPLRIAAVVVVVNLAVNIILVRTPLQQGGLALGTSIAASVNAVLLGWVLRRRLHGLEGQAIVATAQRALLGAGLMAVVAWAIGQLAIPGPPRFDTAHVVAVLAAIAAAAVTYAAVQAFLGSEELPILWSAFRRGRSRLPNSKAAS
jgi:putative peptidoglycan lipid II flippase